MTTITDTATQSHAAFELTPGTHYALITVQWEYETARYVIPLKTVEYKDYADLVRKFVQRDEGMTVVDVETWAA